MTTGFSIFGYSAPMTLMRYTNRTPLESTSSNMMLFLFSNPP